MIILHPITFCLVGGDARQLALQTLLARDGHNVSTLFLSGDAPDLSLLSFSNCILLPVPLSRTDGSLYAPLHSVSVSIPRILDLLSPTQSILGGKISHAVHAAATERGLTLHDITLRNELAIANAVPTAEGAVQLAMEQLPVTIHRCRVLIAGFGRVGQCTAQRFRALGAEVTICARSPAQLSLAETLGCSPLPMPQLSQTSCDFDLVINTVPAPVFDRAALGILGAPLLMELASPPGGFDLGTVQSLGLRLISAPGLPGKVAPVTAARILQKTIYRMLEEFDLGKEGSF